MDIDYKKVWNFSRKFDGHQGLVRHNAANTVEYGVSYASMALNDFDFLSADQTILFKLILWELS